MAFLRARNKPKPLEQHYRPTILTRLSVAPRAAGLSPEATSWRAWSRGLALSTALALIAGLFIRSHSDTAGLILAAGVGLLAFAWSFMLSRLARRTSPLPHIAIFRWTNSIILLGLVTAMLCVTGATLSSLSWLYVPLIVAEALQDRRRGLVVSWLAWGLFCTLLILQIIPGIPETVTGSSANTHPSGVPWFFHAGGVALWYLALAVGSLLFYRWTRQHERALQQQAEHLKQKEEEAVAAQQAARTDQQKFREELGQLESHKRQFETTRQKWEQERQQADLQRAQATQQLKDQEVAMAEQMRQSQQRAERIQQLQRQLDEEQRAWEEQRARAAKALDERDAALAARTQEIEAAHQTFEAQRAQTTKSLMELEATLLERLKRIGEEMAQVEATRQTLEQAQQAFAAERERAMADQSRVTQQLRQKTEEHAAREQQVQRDEEALRHTQEALAKDRERLAQELAARETQLTNRLHEVEATTQRLEAERTQLEQDRRGYEAGQRTRESTEHGKERVHTQELQKLRRMLENAQQELAERKAQYATELTQWEETARTTKEALAARERELEAQRRELAQKAKEAAHAKDAESTKPLETKVTKRAHELDEREERLTRLQKELDVQRRAFEQQAHQKVQLTAKQEQELSTRLEQVEKLREQTELERREFARQREQLEQTHRQVREQQQQLESSWRQVHEARRALADASLEQVPDHASNETLGMLANEFDTPLASLHALLTTVLEGDHGEMSPGMAEALRTIMKTNTRLRRVVSDALDVLRIEQGQFAVTTQPTPLGELIRHAEEGIQDELKRKELTLTRQDNGNLMVKVEPAQAQRIFAALLCNAVQYTERGGITIACAAQGNQAAITITDTGVGMRNEQLAQLFTKPNLGNLLRGKGLSVYLSRLLAKSMEGDVALVSTELGTGTSFTVLLPMAGAPKPPQPADTPSADAVAANP